MFGTGRLESLRRQIETNTLGTLRVTRAFAPILEANGGGAVVNVLSVLSWVTFPAPRPTRPRRRRPGPSPTPSRGELRGAGHPGRRRARRLPRHGHGRPRRRPQTDPADLARQVLDAVDAGDDEVLGDDLSRGVKAGLSGSVAQLSA